MRVRGGGGEGGGGWFMVSQVLRVYLFLGLFLFRFTKFRIFCIVFKNFVTFENVHCETLKSKIAGSQS